MSASTPQPVSPALQRVADLLTNHHIGALLVSPGPDLRYLTGYNAHAMERLTCLVVRPDHRPWLLCPRLEVPSAIAAGVSDHGVDVSGWEETDDPYTEVAHSLYADPGLTTVAVDDRMWATKLLAFQRLGPNWRFVPGSTVLADVRIVKQAHEIAALREAGAAIDRVHSQVPHLLRAGRTEREVRSDIDNLIRRDHDTVDFVIVASGPNAASPHHDCSDRQLVDGDVVVVDIGGTMPSGYCSDSTRTYSIGEPPTEFLAAYEALVKAQSTARAAVRPGVSAETVDAAARDVLGEAGLGEYFIHRTGHGIGMETHEEPYIMPGNSRLIEPGMAFSIEPGFYVQDRWGARIEDIVVCGDGSEVILCNNQPRELVICPR